jgi:hypothetical protein
MDRYSFITEDFHFIFLAGLSGAPRMLGLPLFVSNHHRNSRLRDDAGKDCKP